MKQMFFNCKNFKQPLNSWNIINVTKRENMFQNCPLMTLDLLPRFPENIEANNNRPAINNRPVINSRPTINNIPASRFSLSTIENQVKNKIDNNQPIIQKYNNPIDLNLEVVDYFLLAEEGNENLNGFLKNSPENVVFVYQNKFYFCDKATIKYTLNIKNNIKFGCIEAGTLRPENIVKDKPYLSLRALGLTTGLITLDQIFDILLGSHQLFFVLETSEMVVSTVSLEVLEGGSHVSASHCQEGQGDTVYSIEYIDFPSTLPIETGGKSRKSRKMIKLRKSRKSIKSRKTRKLRKSRKSRKSRKTRKTRKN